jgi:23S rRNA pseudouridine2605 synthase
MSEQGLRVQKAIARAGLASRRGAEQFVAQGRVRINGRVVSEPGTCLEPGDDLAVDGKTLDWEATRPRELWALYKPKRCVSTLSDPEGRATVRDYFPKTSQRIYPIGRLDYDAEGLLLLTNDGDLAQRVAHPSFRVPRVYLVKVKGILTPETLAQLARGVELDGRLRTPTGVRVLHTLADKTWLEVILQEGIQHHIKKMFAAVGHETLKIKRYQIGPVELADMTPGTCRKLSQAEIRALLGEPAEAPLRQRPRSS